MEEIYFSSSSEGEEFFAGLNSRGKNSKNRRGKPRSNGQAGHNGRLFAAIRKVAKLEEDLKANRLSRVETARQLQTAKKEAEEKRSAARELKYENIQLRKEVAALKEKSRQQHTKTRASLSALRSALRTVEDLVARREEESGVMVEEIRLLLLNLARHIQRGYHAGPSYTALTLLDQLFSCLASLRSAMGSKAQKENAAAEAKEWRDRAVEAAKFGAQEEMRRAKDLHSPALLEDTGYSDVLSESDALENEGVGVAEPPVHLLTEQMESEGSLRDKKIRSLITEYRLALVKMKAQLGSTKRLLKKERQQRKGLSHEVEVLRSDSQKYDSEKEVVVSKVLALQEEKAATDQQLEKVVLEKEVLEERCKEFERTLAQLQNQLHHHHQQLQHQHQLNHHNYQQHLHHKHQQHHATLLQNQGPSGMVISQPVQPPVNANVYHHVVQQAPSNLVSVSNFQDPTAAAMTSNGGEKSENTERMIEKSESKSHADRAETKQGTHSHSTEEELQQEVSCLNRDIQNLRNSLAKAALDHTKQILHDAVDAVDYGTGTHTI